MSELPIGVKFIHWTLGKIYPGRQFNSLLWYKLSILLLTFLSYTGYHAAKRPLSIVKSYLQRNCDNVIPPPYIIINDTNRHNWCDWAPFNDTNAGALLGTLDSSFLLSYAFAMFISGFIAERVNLRFFLSIGMILTGISCYLFGIAEYLNIHYMFYFIIVQILGGIVQSSGWPGVVTIMGNWYGKNKRGLIFGLWNSHTSVGNILGSCVASAFLTQNWGLSFIVPGIIIAILGFINFLFLIETPDLIDKEPKVQIQDEADSDTELLNENDTISENEAISMISALKIPGVVEFSLCLFFAKFVSYTLLFWLPFYIQKSTSYDQVFSGYLSTIFDWGGIIGGIMAGIVSDHSGKNALICSIMLIISIPLLIIYYIYGAINLYLNGFILALLGFFVNGPYALITTAVSAELGTHRSLANSSKALATVTAIIDGTGSVGAAIGPFLTGIIFSSGWLSVFLMLIGANVLAFLALVSLVKKEINPHVL